VTQEQPTPKETDLSNVSYIISDWDGTLVDSFPDYTAAFARLMQEKFGVDPKQSKPYYISTAGEALTNQIRIAAQRFTGQDVDDTVDLEQLFWDFQKDSDPPPVIDGANQTLETLVSNGFKIAVWSGTRTDILGIKLQQTGLRQFVDFEIGNTPGSTTQVKGSVLFKEIAKHFGISASDLCSQSVVIGDGVGDIRAGQAVNCPTVGILKTQTKDIFIAAGADFIIPSIKDLPSLLIH